MKNNDSLSWLGCGLSAVFTGLQTEELFRIIQLVLTCLATVVTLAFTIYKWWKKAKEDNKITFDELAEGANIVSKGIDDIQKQIESSKKEVSDKSEGEK